jgi:hypothetical protein
MIVEGNMSEKEYRDMFEAINASAKIKIRELQIMTGLVDMTKTKGNKIIPMIVSLGLRFQKIQNHLNNTKQKQRSRQRNGYFVSQLGDQAKKKIQFQMTDIFERKPKATPKN